MSPRPPRLVLALSLSSFAVTFALAPRAAAQGSTASIDQYTVNGLPTEMAISPDSHYAALRTTWGLYWFDLTLPPGTALIGQRALAVLTSSPKDSVEFFADNYSIAAHGSITEVHDLTNLPGPQLSFTDVFGPASDLAAGSLPTVMSPVGAIRSASVVRLFSRVQVPQ